MKFFYSLRIRNKLYELIKMSSIQNHTNDYLNSLDIVNNKLPRNVDFYDLVHDTYAICLKDNISTLKYLKYDTLHAAIFVITRVFQDQSERPNSHQEMRKSGGKLGELMSEASFSLYLLAKELSEQNPSLILAFNTPHNSIFADIEKAREYSKTIF